MKKTFLIFILLLSAGFVMAQQQLTVKIKDSKTGEALSNATVKIKSTKKEAPANADGIILSRPIQMMCWK